VLCRKGKKKISLKRYVKGTMKQNKGYHVKPLMGNKKEIKFSSILSSVKLRIIKEPTNRLHRIPVKKDEVGSNEIRWLCCC
jgi:hypothetical protein